MHHGIGALLRRIARQVWARAALYTVLSVVFVLAAGAIGAALPFRLVADIGQDSVGSILQITASSMLAVTTFSLTAMVTAYSSATTTATPRATQLMVQDTTSQNALSTFVGGFTFSLVGVIALSSGYYGDEGRAILFGGTLVMITLIVVTLLRWIAHLARFGRMSDVIDRVEAAASRSLCAFAQAPALGARRIDDFPGDGRAVWAEEPGYVTFVDVAAIARVADAAEVEVVVRALPGSVADATTPLALVLGAIDDTRSAAIARAFRIDPHRDYDQDPRLGVIALAEIGSRALSPATNDPGTAIEVIAALQRTLTRAIETTPDDDVTYPRVRVRPLRLTDLVVDAFRPLARDGADHVEVQMRLHKCLRALTATAPQHAEHFRAAAAESLSRARGRLLPREIRSLEALWEPALLPHEDTTAPDEHGSGVPAADR